MDESGLVRRLKARDEEAMGELLKAFGPLLRYVMRPILPDPRLREEALSELSLHIWERFESYDPEKGGLKTWLSVLARNQALNTLRQESRHGAEELDETRPDEAPGPEDELLRKERAEALRQALGTLSERDRALIYRKYYYRQTTAQMAAETGLSERAVEGRLYRARQALRDKLGGIIDD